MWWSKWSIKWLEENLITPIQICATDQSYFEFLNKTFLVSLFQLLLFPVLWKYVYFKSEFTVYSQVPNTAGVLIVMGGGGGGLQYFSKFNKWMGFNKKHVRKLLTINKQVFCLYAVESCPWKFQVIWDNQVNFSSSFILTCIDYATVLSFHN